MKRLVSFLFFLSFVISACNMGAATPAAANQPVPEVILASPTIQPTFTQIVPLAATSTLVIPSPVPQLVLPATVAALPPQSGTSSTIQFAAGGTWKDTQDSVALGGSKVYTLNAMQGQVMSVSIIGGYFPLQIQGRNGTVLCPVEQDRECSYWRGTLPLSQDYYITVKSGGMGTNFTLRVAINPPGKAEQMFSYVSGNASLLYSDQFAPADPLSVLNNKTNLLLTLQLIDTSSYINTNLGESYFILGSSSNRQVAATCTEPNQNSMPETSNGNVAANGYNFAYTTVSDAGAGNIYEQHIYRTVNNGTCYEVIYFIHSSNIGNYTPGVVKEFDRQGLMMKFSRILSSIQLK